MIPIEPKCSECYHLKSGHRLASAGGCFFCECRRFHGPLEKASKMMTVAFRERLMPVKEDSMCWEASLAAFGIVVPHDDWFRQPPWILAQLEDAGWQVRTKQPSQLVPAAQADDHVTLAVLMPQLATGDWLVLTHQHVIAVRDGDITDTAGTARTVKRRVWLVYEVMRAGAKIVSVAPACGCLEPLVFGHAPGHRWKRGMQL